MRMATLPGNHPLTTQIRSARRNQKRHKSPLHQLFNNFNINPNAMGTIQPIRNPPQWSPRVTIDMADDAIYAALQDIRAENEDDVCLYSDRSGFKGKIGAAILRRGGETKRSLKFHLGTEKDHTVFEGEEVGMILAAELLQGEQRTRKVSLGIDNKAAIAAARSHKAKSGHYLMDHFHHTLIAALQTIEVNKIIIQWTPGHLGILGNEEANAEAKETARGTTSAPHLLPKVLRMRDRITRTLPMSKTARKRVFNASTKALHIQIFQTSP